MNTLYAGGARRHGEAAQPLLAAARACILRTEALEGQKMYAERRAFNHALRAWRQQEAPLLLHDQGCSTTPVGTCSAGCRKRRAKKAKTDRKTATRISDE